MSKWRGWFRVVPPRTPWGAPAVRDAILAPYLPQGSQSFSFTASGGLTSGGTAAAEYVDALDGGAATLGVTGADGYSGSDAGSTPPRNTQASTGLLVFAQWEFDSTPPTITDNKGNTFGAPFRTLAPGAGSLTNYLGAWFLPGATGGAGHVVTATLLNAYPSVWVVEVPDATAITHVGASATASPFSSGDLTTTGTRLLVGFVGDESTGVVNHTITSSGFTELDALEDGAAEWTGVTAHRTAPAGTYSFAASVSGVGVGDGGAILVAVEGSGSGAADYPYTATGGLTTGGTAALERTYSRTASGGLTAGGAAGVTFTSAGYSVTGSGGVTLGGAGLLERTYTRVATGGLVLGGAAGIATTVAPPAGGDLALGGSAGLARTFAGAAAGGLVTGGAADTSTSTGSATYTHVASGGVVLGGEAEAGRVYTYVAQPPELGTGPGEPQPPQVIVQETGGGYVEYHTATLAYVGGGRVRIRGAAQAFATIREPASVLRLASGPRMRLRGSANAYALPRPRRNRDLEDLALANLARTAR